MQDAAGRRLMKEARRIRRQGRPDKAAAMLASEGDLTDPGVGGVYLGWMAELDEPRSFQEVVRQTIRRLESAGAPPDPGYLSQLSRHAEFACIETVALERVLAMSARAPTDDDQLLRARKGLRRRVAFRREALPRWGGHATLISLGLNCMPWNLLNTWGLRTPDEYVRLFTPFALAVHQFKGVLNDLSNDFEHYCRPDRLTAIETVGGHMVPGRTDAQIFWNHHRGPYWIDDGFARLRENLAWKIEAFRLACRREDAVFIMGKAPVHFPREPIRFLDDLNAGLERFTGRDRNRVMFWDEHADEDACLQVDDWTFVLNSRMPGTGGAWYDADAEDGMAFEEACVTAVLASLSDWGLLSLADDAPAGVAGAPS